MFAVVDTETTGLDPRRGHRVIELGVVHVDAELEITSEWDTLLNPERNVGASEVHGLRFSDVEDAPRFEEVAGDLLEFLDQRIVVSHNTRFDVGFLAAEFRRVGYTFRPDSLCTLELADGLRLPTRLAECCECVGVELGIGHAARVDAHTVASMLPVLLARSAEAGLPLRFAPFSAGEIALARNGRRLARLEPFRPDTQAFVAGLIRRMHVTPTGGVDAPDHAASAYANVLDRVLEDRVVSEEEARSLSDLAREWSLGPEQVADIHYSYVAALTGVALADGVLSRPELADIGRVATLLTIDPDALDSLVAGAEAAAAHGFGRTRACGFNPQLGGKTVHFAGPVGCSVGGKAMTNSEAELLAAAAGLVVAPHLTPAVDLVVACEDAPSDDVDRARSYGAHLVAERVFWLTIGVGID